VLVSVPSGGALFRPAACDKNSRSAIWLRVDCGASLGLEFLGMSSVYRQSPLDLGGVRTRSIAGRFSRVSEEAFAAVPKDKSFEAFWDSLPDILAGQRLREAARAIVKARRQKRNILWGIGGHVIKCGLSPLLLHLLREGFVQGIAANGA